MHTYKHKLKVFLFHAACVMNGACRGGRWLTVEHGVKERQINNLRRNFEIE